MGLRWLTFSQLRGTRRPWTRGQAWCTVAISNPGTRVRHDIFSWRCDSEFRGPVARLVKGIALGYSRNNVDRLRRASSDNSRSSCWSGSPFMSSRCSHRPSGHRLHNWEYQHRCDYTLVEVARHRSGWKTTSPDFDVYFVFCNACCSLREMYSWQFEDLSVVGRDVVFAFDSSVTYLRVRVRDRFLGVLVDTH